MVDTSVRSVVGPVTVELRRLTNKLHGMHPHLLPMQVAPATAPRRMDTGGEPQRAGVEQWTQRVTQQQTMLQSAAINVPSTQSAWGYPLFPPLY